jgi:hypothetical protein
MGRGHDEHERYAMHRDYLESRVLTDRKAKKSNIERAGLNHRYLMYASYGAVSLLDAPLILVLPLRTIAAALKSAGKE